jgi:hypothetical protein
MAKTNRPHTPLEKEVQANGIKLLKALGWTVHRRNTGAWAMAATNTTKRRYVRASTPGMADTFGELPDRRHFELEFKRAGERPTEKQLAWLKSTNSEHCVSFWVDDTKALEWTARLLMDGHRIVWQEGEGYHVER